LRENAGAALNNLHVTAAQAVQHGAVLGELCRRGRALEGKQPTAGLQQR